uniref:Ig-like domain-containing protein n=1 Tax=Poecilia latipinna TaxID=48699 RepID=A0A3B3TPD3_9TELE
MSVITTDISIYPVNVTVIPGEDVTLTCRAAGNGKVSVLRLTRDDLQPDSVLLYRDGQIDEEQQNPLYKGRTKLPSLISTDGEINLTLNSVTEKDSGVYECRVRTEIKSNTRRKRAVRVCLWIRTSSSWFWISDQMMMIFSGIRLTPGSVLQVKVTLDW